MSTRIILSAGIMTLVLSACGGGGSAQVTVTSTTGISVAAVSGGTVTLDGTYSTGCYGAGANFVKEDLVISGNTWNYVMGEYNSSTCTTTVNAGAISATLATSATGNVTITGWVDGMGATTTAPTAADGSGPLSNSETVTPLDLTVVSASGSMNAPVGATFPMFYVVDDTAANTVLYRDYQYSAGTGTVAGNFDPLIKQ